MFCFLFASTGEKQPISCFTWKNTLSSLAQEYQNLSESCTLSVELSTSVPLCTWANVPQERLSALSSLGLHIYLWKKCSRHSARERTWELWQLETFSFVCGFLFFFFIFMWLYMFISSLKDGEVGPFLCCLTIFLSVDAWISQSRGSVWPESLWAGQETPKTTPETTGGRIRTLKTHTAVAHSLKPPREWVTAGAEMCQGVF